MTNWVRWRLVWWGSSRIMYWQDQLATYILTIYSIYYGSHRKETQLQWTCSAPNLSANHNMGCMHLPIERHHQFQFLRCWPTSTRNILHVSTSIGSAVKNKKFPLFVGLWVKEHEDLKKKERRDWTQSYLIGLLGGDLYGAGLRGKQHTGT